MTIAEVGPHVREQLNSYFEGFAARPSRFDDSFPEGFAEYLFLHESYLDDERIWQAIAEANAAVGNDTFVFSAKEYTGTEPPVDLLVPNVQWRLMYEQVVGALEFYLVGPEQTWLVWAYHEPCLHIGGTGEFMGAFKAAFPQWRSIVSPWYEGGVPVCKRCGRWWSPGQGDHRLSPWYCPEHTSQRR